MHEAYHVQISPTPIWVLPSTALRIGLTPSHHPSPFLPPNLPSPATGCTRYHIQTLNKFGQVLGFKRNLNHKPGLNPKPWVSQSLLDCSSPPPPRKKENLNPSPTPDDDYSGWPTQARLWPSGELFRGCRWDDSCRPPSPSTAGASVCPSSCAPSC
jgi:hypothetical protein